MFKIKHAILVAVLVVFAAIGVYIVWGMYYDARIDDAREARRTQQENSGPMTQDEARRIAGSSVCVSDGALGQNSFYNENSKTWWIDLNIMKEGCSPACVVSEETKTAEINWRCTGLLEPVQ